MKRSSFQPAISTLIIGASLLGSSLCIVSPTRAYDIEASAVDPGLLPVGTEINGQRYWSVAEMIEASELINAKREEFCQGDPMCEEELPWQQMDELGGLYRALDPYENVRFMLTSVNPSANTVKFLYHDEDKMLSRMLGKPIRHDIASIYTVWVEESLGSITTTSSNWLAYGQRAPYHLGSAEEVETATHLIFDESEDRLGRGWFTPNIEREYLIEGSNLVDNTTAQIHYSLDATGDGGHVHGTLDYSSCFNSPDYTDGMECKMMYAEDGSYAYLPLAPAITMRAESEPITTPTEPEVTYDPEEPISSTAETPSAEATDINAPDTGTATREDCSEENSTEFPWWTIVLPFIFMFFIFSWWFILPLFKNSNEKNG